MCIKNAIFILAMLFMAGCTSRLPSDQAPPSGFQSCTSDADCIPQPGCHPQNCINLDYEDRFDKPQVCTELFSCSAAYAKEDCLCKGNICINRYTIEPNPDCGN